MNFYRSSFRNVLTYTGIVFYSFILLLLIEWIYRDSVRLVYKWLRNEYHEFLLVYIFILAIFLFFHTFKRKVYYSLSFSFSLVLIILSVVNRIKIALRGDPLLPADLVMFSEAKAMLSFLSGTPVWKIILLGLILIGSIVGIVFFIIKVRKDEHWHWHRVLIGLLALSLATYIYFEEVETKYSDIRSKWGIKTIDYNQTTNYELNGFLMAFLRNIKWLSIDPPQEYTKETVDELVGTHKKEPYSVTSEKPHIVMIMSEAFWDPTKIDSVSFNQDPLPNFHELQKKYTSGSLMVPVFGGSTANTEFEALTGYSMNFLPTGSIPYLFYLNKPVNGLPHMLKDQGYDTTAIHSYHNWFYKRNIVYENLGFDRFVSLEFIPNPVVDFLYYRDREVNDLIINQLKSAENPNFIFTVSMQNHGPYKDDMKKPYAVIETTAKNNDIKLSESSKNILEFYSDNLVQVDKELQRLIEELEKINEKVMVVYFGDHLPLLGPNYQVYKETNYLLDNQNNYSEYQKVYNTPLLIWDNFSDTNEELNISSSFLSPYILKRIGLEGNSLTNLLNIAIEEGNGIFPRKDFLEKTSFDMDFYRDYEMLQYDAMFGKRYSSEAGVGLNNNFELGYHDPTISDMKIKKVNGKQFIVIEGDYLTKFSSIFINGKGLDTVYQEGSLQAEVNNDLKGNIKIQIKVLDSYDRVLRESAVTELEFQ
jgi:phosphoglycerol transferase MdoB-like AlkP superfamily enzyme